ncbi:MAG: hypothetical protein WBI17_13640 [Clostridiaceae bacterium]
MQEKILVVTHSILDQNSLSAERRVTEGALSVVKDLVDLHINLIQVPDIENNYASYLKRELTDEDKTSQEYLAYIKRALVPLVNGVMDRVKKNALFYGVLSYGGDDSQRVEPETSPIMIELFRLFDRKCMLTPYYEINEMISNEDLELAISDISVALAL